MCRREHDLARQQTGGVRHGLAHGGIRRWRVADDIRREDQSAVHTPFDIDGTRVERCIHPFRLVVAIAVSGEPDRSLRGDLCAREAKLHMSFPESST